MNIEQRIRHYITFLYGEENTDQIWSELTSILDAFRKNSERISGRTPDLSERDAILITYGDSIQTFGQPALKTLKEFLNDHLAGSISGIHILPFYPYSSDDGFSVIDFRQVNPALGDWEDIAVLGKSYRLMFDAVINHVSRQSNWFQSYLRAETPYRNYFITPPPDWDLSQVVRPRTHPLLTPVETVQGSRRVWTTFSDDQIDLNYADPEVLLEIVSLLLFYIEKGASILRLDAIAYLWKESGTACIHLPQTHAVIKLLRAVLDAIAPDVLLITETNVPHEKNISYFGELLPDTGRTDEAQLVYQFPLASLILHTFASSDAMHLSKWVATLGNQGMFFNFIASHDGIGVLPAQGILSEEEIGSLVSRTLTHGGQVSYKSNPDGTQSPYELNITLYDALNDPASQNLTEDIERFMASQTIMLSLAGLPGIYIHSLFGSRNDQQGVESTGQARSINREKFDLRALRSVLSQPESREAQILSRYIHLLDVRREQPAFHPLAEQEVLAVTPDIFSMLRRSRNGAQTILCLTNVTSAPTRFCPDAQCTGLPADASWQDLISRQNYASTSTGLEIHLKPYQSCWLLAANT